jgi:hypothetical protein
VSHLKRLLLALFLIISLAEATNINSCTNLVNASSPYVMNASITGVSGTCMNFTQNNIILNMAGFTITGTNAANKYGFNMTSHSGLVLENGTFTNFTTDGYMVNVNSSRIKNVTIKNTGSGISFNGASYLDNFTNNTFQNLSGHGVDWVAANYVSSCVISNNIYSNVAANCITINTNNNSITGNTLSGCGNEGVRIGTGGYADASNNYIFNNTISNASYAVSWAVALNVNGIGGSGGNSFVNNTVFNMPSNVYAVGIDAIALGNNSINGLFIYNSSMTLSILNTTTISNLAIGYNSTMGIVNWTGPITISSLLLNSTNLLTQPDYLSLDSSSASSLNTTASLKITTDVGCLNQTVWTKDGLPSSSADITSTGTINYLPVTCASGIANFTVPSFTGYALGGNFSVTNVLPADLGSADANTSFEYNITTIASIQCDLFIDSTLSDSSIVSTNGSQDRTLQSGGGIHTWYVACNDTVNAITTPTWIFTTSQAVSNSIILNATAQNLTASPTSLFFDPQGNLTVLYFTNKTPTNTLYIQKAVNGLLNQTWTANVNATKAFFIGFREASDLWLFTYKTDNVTRVWLNISGAALTATNSATTYNVVTNSYYDPMTYANTKNIPTITNQTGSFYLYILPTTTDSRLIRLNLSSTTTQDLNSTNTTSSYQIIWQTIAQNSNLTSWFYAFPTQAGCVAGKAKISIFLYNGSSQALNATPDNNCYSATDMNASHVFFEQFGNKTYALLANLVGNTTIFDIEDNKSYNFNRTIANPSRMIFVDQSTVIFFNTEAGDTFAYSCYFGGVNATCSRFSSSVYGAVVPYASGAMVTSKRSGTTDITTNGALVNNAYLSLAYTETDYDVKYVCNNELSWASRLPFTVQTFSNTTSTVLSNQSYGYVMPSAMFGNGTKNTFFLCQTGVQREIIAGLNSSYFLNFYSLDNVSGAYYTFTVKDAYGQLVPNVLVTAYRYNTVTNTQVIIAQGISDFTGTVILYLQPFVPYTLVVTATNYATISSVYTPGTNTNPQIVLGASGAQIVVMPNWNYEANDISWTITPVEYAIFNATNASFQISANNSDLLYFGMILSQVNMSNLTTVCIQNVTTSPGGGIVYCSINQTGTYHIQPFWQVAGYQARFPTAKVVTYSNGTSYNDAFKTFQQNQPIGPWGFYAIALVLAMVAGGWVAKYTVDGAGLAVIAVLWFFTFFNPNACLVPVAGANSMLSVIYGAATICISPLVATTFATIATVSALFLVKYL